MNQFKYFSFILLIITTGNATANDIVDPETFVGWRMYHDSCVMCHGVGGVGSEIAPDLTESVKRLSLEEFRSKVLHRYLVEIPGEDAMAEGRAVVRNAFLNEIYKKQAAEEAGLPMPEWKHNPIVAEHVDYIYQYLKARSTGAIGPGHPEIMKE